MKKLKIIIVIFVFLLLNGCHTHLHFAPALTPKIDINSTPKKDTTVKKNSHDKNFK